MAVTKIQARKVRLPTLTGDYALSAFLDASTTVDIVTLSCAAESITVQSDGNLAGTIEFSVNGVNFANSTAFAANALVPYGATLIRVIRVTRTSGSGKLHIISAG